MTEATCDICAGDAFADETLVIDAAYQRRQHGFCDIAPSVYGDRVDPTFLARRPIPMNVEMMQSRHPDCGYVHVIQRIVQVAPVRLGEALVLRGRVTAVEPVARCWMVKSEFHLTRADGALAVTVLPEILLADRARMEAPGNRPGAHKDKPRAASAEDSGFEVLTTRQCTPEATLGYCEGSTNLIHLDPDYAREYGFRAPIIAGNQTINFLMEGLAADGPPDSLDSTIRFRRPVFWDDALTVTGRRAAGEDGHTRLRELRARNAHGKIVAECRIDSLG